MKRHYDIAPIQTSFDLSTQFPSLGDGTRGSMPPPGRSSLPPLPPNIGTTSKQNELQNFNPGPRLSQPVFSFGSLSPMTPAPFTRPTTYTGDNYSAGLHSMDAEPIEMPVGPGEKEPHGEVASFMDEYVSKDKGNSTLGLGIEKGVFTASQMMQIESCERLKKLAVADPKHVKRILSTREASKRTREKKARSVLELEKTRHALEKEAARVTAFISNAERTKLGLEEENKQIRVRLQEMEEQAEVDNALTEYYNGEINRLKQRGTGEVLPNLAIMYENMLMEQLLYEEPEPNKYGFE